MPHSNIPQLLAAKTAHHGAATGSSSLVNLPSGKTRSKSTFPFRQVALEELNLNVPRRSDSDDQGDHPSQHMRANQTGVSDKFLSLSSHTSSYSLPSAPCFPEPSRNSQVSNTGNVDQQIWKLQNFKGNQASQREANLSDHITRIAELEMQLVVLKSKLRIQQAIQTVSSERISTLSSCLRAAVEDIEAISSELHPDVGLDFHRRLSSASLHAVNHRHVLGQNLPDLMACSSHKSSACSHCGESLWEGARQERQVMTTTPHRKSHPEFSEDANAFSQCLFLLNQPMCTHTSRASGMASGSGPSGYEKFDAALLGPESLTLPPIHAVYGSRSTIESCHPKNPQESLKNYIVNAQETVQNYTSGTLGTHAPFSCSSHQARLECGPQLNESSLVARPHVTLPSITISTPFEQSDCLDIGISVASVESSAMVNPHSVTGSTFPAETSNAMPLPLSQSSGDHHMYASSGSGMDTEPSPVDLLPICQMANSAFHRSQQYCDESPFPSPVEGLGSDEAVSSMAGHESALEEFWRCDHTWDLPRSFDDDAISVRLASQKLQFQTRSSLCSPLPSPNARPADLFDGTFGPLLEAPICLTKKRKREPSVASSCDDQLHKKAPRLRT